MTLAATEAAKDKIKNTGIILSELELRKSQKDTTDARDMIERLGNPPIESLEGIKDIMSASTKGKPLAPYQLERIASAMTSFKRLREYLARGKAFENPLAYYDENIDPLDDVREEIFRQIRNSQVDSHASARLLGIRNEIMDTEEKMKQKADQVMRSNKEYMADSFSTYRNGRLCVPVKKEWKFKIPGSTIDKSASGNTLFIEPLGCAKYHEELELLRIDEENEIYQILFVLTAMVSDSISALESNIAILEKLDYVFSKGKLSIDLKCVEPDIVLGNHLSLKNARHPLMDINTSVPLNLSMGDGCKGIIITGPNTGGKTVAIKTVALNCMMAQCGLHVAAEEAQICMRSSYLCDIGDGQNISENLSTFSAHIKNVLNIISEMNSESLVIMDELGSGTDPTEGMGIAIAILEELRKSGCLFLVTTHYPEVKEYAKQAEGIVNARMTFDRNTLSPTYTMIVGEAGESCAFYIAERLGMPKSMLQTAVEAAYGEKAAKEYVFAQDTSDTVKRGAHKGTKIKKNSPTKRNADLSTKYKRGDSVMIFPDRKIGIVVEPINEEGILRVQIAKRKIWISHKRVKLHVAAEKLYPADYDFSIIFDSVATRKARHEMSRKLTETELRYDEEDPE